MTKASPAPQLRVAAYCRIAGGEEQNAVLESQRACYTKQIGVNPDWIMAGIFTDIGDSRSKCPEFQKMLRKCRHLPPASPGTWRTASAPCGNCGNWALR